MASANDRAQLVVSMKDAETDAKNGLETLFLIQLVTAAVQDKNPKYTLREVYEALLDAKAWSLLDPLYLLPLLMPSDKDGASDLLHTISQEGNAKEIIISVQETLERLRETVKSDIDDGAESGQTYITQLTRLLSLCAIPRLQLRQKSPVETLRPIMAHLGAAIEAIAPLADRDGGRNLISSVSTLITSISSWLTRNAHKDQPDLSSTEPLSTLLYLTLTACAVHIRASVAQRRFETYAPRLVLRSAINPSSERGKEVVEESLDVARVLGLTPEILASRPLSFGKLILLAHEQPNSLPTSFVYIQNLIPILTSSLQQNIAIDESLALLFTFVSTSPHNILPQEVVDPIAALIAPLASTHPDPPTRLVAFRLLASLLSRAPAPVHLAHLSSLLIECPFPQMRVAAVGLVKEAFLSAITSSDTSPFKSTAFLRVLGPTLFRPDPPDLFASITKDSLNKFLESFEPARLTECLAFYYVLIKRDTNNSSGIRDRDMLRTVENGLLNPLRKTLAVWLDDSSSLQDNHAFMPLASLKTSLERVDAAVASL